MICYIHDKIILLAINKPVTHMPNSEKSKANIAKAREKLKMIMAEGKKAVSEKISVPDKKAMSDKKAKEDQEEDVTIEPDYISESESEESSSESDNPPSPPPPPPKPKRNKKQEKLDRQKQQEDMIKTLITSQLDGLKKDLKLNVQRARTDAVLGRVNLLFDN